MEYTVNKGRLRSPFKAGTKIDVIMRSTAGITDYVGYGEAKRLDDHRIEVIGAVSGMGNIVDWTVEGNPGDVLEYRLHEGEAE